MTDYVEEEQQLRNQIQLEMGENPDLIVCLQQYFKVKKCWNDYEECLRHNMTFEKACHTLREVRDASWRHGRAGKRLSEQAHKLLWEIVDHSSPIQEVESATNEKVEMRSV